VSVSRDTGLGVLAVVVAGAYYAEATTIQQSLLADAVGADGVPRMLAFGMGMTGLVLAGRSVLRPATAAADDLPISAHLRAAGLLSILIIYLLAVPIAGYPLSVAALIAAVAVYAGARINATLAITAVAGAAAFWLMFKWLLGIQLPVGMLSWG
jgi:putative tricarboxylic transport membrane protein